MKSRRSSRRRHGSPSESGQPSPSAEQDAAIINLGAVGELVATLDVVGERPQTAPDTPGTSLLGLVRRIRAGVTPVSIFLAVGLTALLLGGTGSLGAFEPIEVGLIAIGTVAVLGYSVWRYRPSLQWPWIAIGTALTLFIADGLARSELHTLGNLTASRSLVPDYLALPGYAILGAGLIGFTCRRIRGRYHHSSVVLDGLIATLSLASIALVFAIAPVLDRTASPIPVKAVLVAYPSMSIFLVVVTLRLAFSREQDRAPSYWFMVSAMASMFLGDVLYMFADIDVIHVAGYILDVPYTLAYVCAGCMALHPSMRKLTEVAKERRVSASRGRLSVVAGALVIPALLTLPHARANLGDQISLFALVVILAIAVALRVVQALYAAERSEARLSYQANHDGLTGLPNRHVLEERLSQMLERRSTVAPAELDETHVAVLFLDLDRFKLVNDTLGHKYGDDLLVEVADRLRAHVRGTDLVSRIGGDEFMVVLGSLVTVSDAVALADRLRSALRAPFHLAGSEFFLSASVGLAFASGDDASATVEVLVRDADTAMYRAKGAGRDALAVFSDSMRAELAEKVALEHDMRVALSERQMHLVYQPIVRVPHGRIDGVEALLRWEHPVHGPISPAVFIPLAEETGLINEIGSWVLEEAVSQLAAWKRQSTEMKDLYVSVNLSGGQMHDEHIVERVSQVLTDYGVEPSSLCLELTESMVMDRSTLTATILDKLRKLGVRLAIDDFGTEYSALAYLKRFPVTSLKIDKSFVDKLDQPGSSDESLVAAMVAMAKALGISTVAEGVETTTQSDKLVALGCDAIQGYLYSKPVRTDQISAVMASLPSQRLQLLPASA